MVNLVTPTAAPSREPKQIGPKDVVAARTKLYLTTLLFGVAEALNHHEATAPDVVQCTTFVNTLTAHMTLSSMPM